MATFSNRVQSFDKALGLLAELSSSWGASSAESRRMTLLRQRCEQEAKCLEDLASALSVENKTSDELAQSFEFLQRAAPSVRAGKLQAKLGQVVERLREDLVDALAEEEAAKALTCSLALEKCGRGEEVEGIFEQTRAWQVLTYKDWCIEAKKERGFAAKTMPNVMRTNAAFERAAIASIHEFIVSLQEEDPRRRASKVKSLSDFLPELKEACGPAQGAKAEWDAVLARMKARTKTDAEIAAREHPAVKWCSSFHGVEPACLEVFGLLVRAGLSAEPPQSVLITLLDRLRDSLRGRETDIFALLGCCNSLDYLIGYLDEFTPERKRAMTMLRTCKDGFVRMACAELNRHGESFVKQSARYFQVQNPVLRTELRLEVAKAWKNANLAKRQSSADSNTTSNLSSTNLDESFSGSSSQVGGVVALFFEGPTGS